LPYHFNNIKCLAFKRIKVPEPYSHAVPQPVTAFCIYVNGNCPEFWGADLVKTRVGLPRLGKRSERSQQEIRTQEQAIATQQKLQQEEGELPIEYGTQKTARDAPRLPERQVKTKALRLAGPPRENEKNTGARH
jgi:hypothetical protein